jgi:hypothetical protein
MPINALPPVQGGKAQCNTQGVNCDYVFDMLPLLEQQLSVYDSNMSHWTLGSFFVGSMNWGRNEFSFYANRTMSLTAVTP